MNGGSLSTWNEPDPGKKWGKTIAVSLVLHALLFLFLLHVLPPSPAGRLPEPAYVVNLVSLGGEPAPGSTGAGPPPPKTISEPLPPRPAPPPQAIPLPKAPPVVEKKIAPPAADSQALDRALERMRKKKDQERSLERSFHRLENKVKNQEALEQTLARLERKAAAAGKGGGGSGGEGSVSSANPAGSPGAGLQFQMYHASLRARIKKNWVLPEGLLKQGDISADLILRISRNGKIEDFHFERKSGVSSFDQEVVRTLQKSDPLPPLPEGYPRNSYEVVLTFHSRDLGGQ